jgi:SpoVK/Ycf46/Vps4 family AAA+-type ATPase
MSDPAELIEALQEALAVSPDNPRVRQQLGKMLQNAGRHEEAERVYREGLRLAPNSESMKLGLAKCFYHRGKTSEALVLVEDVTSRPDPEPEAHKLHCLLLMRRGDLEAAARAYRRAVQADPKQADAGIAQALDLPEHPEEQADEDSANRAAAWDDADVDEQGRIRRAADPSAGQGATEEPERPSIGFENVGGMDAVKQEIRIKIIAPLEKPELYKAYGKTVGGGVLMYGPPGCGKTHLARATAGQVQASFLAVGIQDVLDMYFGNSEQRLHRIFEQARRNTPCVLFFDEVDALGANRRDLRASGGRNLVNQFLSELDGVNTSNEGVLILAATNAPWHLDPAFRRPGRFDRILFVPPPDEPGREAILRLHLADKPAEGVDTSAVAKKTKDFSGADLKALVDTAVEEKLEQALASGTPVPITTKDLLRAMKRVKPSTRDWFASARNYALYANEGGLYDEIREYLKL